MPKKSLIIVVFLVSLLFGGVSMLVYKSGTGSFSDRLDAFQKQYSLFLTPVQKFEKALEITNSLDTAHMEFDGSVNTKLTNNTGLTANQKGKVAGYITGSTDGNTQRIELRISGEKETGIEVIVGIISVDNGETLYVSGPATKGKWQKYSKADWDKISESSITDASLYIFDIVSTLFSKSKALLASANLSDLKALESKDGLDHYKVEISVPSYIESQDSDEEYTDKDIKESSIILKEAIISGEFWVDQQTNYVTSMNIEAKNMRNVPTEESTKMGISAKFDSIMQVKLSRFNLPTNISAPDETEIVKPSVNQVKIKSFSDLQK